MPTAASGVMCTPSPRTTSPKLTATNGSAAAARLALTHHPLVDSAAVASALLADYRAAFGELDYLR